MESPIKAIKNKVKKTKEDVLAMPGKAVKKTVEGIKKSPEHLWRNKKGYAIAVTSLFLIYTNALAVVGDKADKKLSSYLNTEQTFNDNDENLSLKKDNIDITVKVAKAFGKGVLDVFGVGAKKVGDMINDENKTITINNTKDIETKDIEKKTKNNDITVEDKVDNEVVEKKIKENNGKEVVVEIEEDNKEDVVEIEEDNKEDEDIVIKKRMEGGREVDKNGVPIYSHKEVLDLAEKVAEENFPDTEGVGNVFLAVVSAESGFGNQHAKSLSDKTIDGKPFSVGATQINMTVHDIELLDGTTLEVTKAFRGINYDAVVVDQELYDKAVIALSDPEVAFLNAMKIARNRNFNQWGAYSSGVYINYMSAQERQHYVDRHNRIWDTNLALDVNGKVFSNQK